MGLNDIWRNVSKEIGFYTKETFQNVPPVPGVYAWFYPLRILTKDANAFVNQVNAVLNYDAGSKGVPKLQSIFAFKWEQVAVDLEFGNKQFELQKFQDLWDAIIEDEKRFELLRQSIMKASIFMPPLYVGKTVNLNTRCVQHVEGTDKDNDFHRRYDQFAAKISAPAREVRDLLFVCVRLVSDDEEEKDSENSDLEGLIEHMLKSIAKPPYSRM